MNKDDMQAMLEAMAKGGISVKGDLVLEKKVEYEVDNVEAGGIGIQINQGQAPVASKTYTDDDAKEEALRAENSIFVLQTPAGAEVRLWRLKQFVLESFMPWAESKHNWVALWQLLKENGLLQHGKRDYNAFAQQMSCRTWSEGIDPKIACTLEGMRYYAGVDDFTFDEWDKILEKGGGSTKTNEKGLLEIKKLYKQLRKEFQIAAILR